MKIMTSKVAAVAAGLAIATSMLTLAPVASAATLTSSQISSILSLLSSFGANSATIANVDAALNGTSSTSGSTTTTTGNSSCAFSRSLTIGSTGADVTCLQNGLIGGGFSIPAGATGYFGTQTRAAVASWQSSRNVAPAVGYFGPISRAAWNLGGTSSSSSTTTTTTTTTTVAGCAAGALYSSTSGAACGTTTTTAALTGSGRLTNVSSLGDTTSDIREGAVATNVAGFSADATGGDVAIQRVDVRFDITPGSGSSNLDAYVSDVSLWLDGKKIANMDPALGDKSTGAIWDLRFTGLNGVIKSGQTGNLYVKVTPVTGANSANTGIIVPSFVADSVRAVGADGISDTYPVSAITASSFTVTAATTGTLVASLATDNPAAGIVAVASSTTAGVNLLSLNLKAKNSAVTVTDLAASIGVSAASTIGAVVSQVQLMKGSTVLKTGTIDSTTGYYSTVTFSGVDQTIAKDATGSYWISVDLKSDAYADGTTIIASTTDTATLWDVSDADGNTVTPTVTVTGNTMTLTATGITVVRGTPTASVANGLTGKGDIATFTIPFTVTAGDTAVFIGNTTTEVVNTTTSFASASGLNYATTTGSTALATQQPIASFSAADTNALDDTTFYVAANTARTFTLTVAVTASSTAASSNGTSSGFVGIILKAINYSNTSTMGATFYTSNLSSYKTNDVYVSLR